MVLLYDDLTFISAPNIVIKRQRKETVNVYTRVNLTRRINEKMTRKSKKANTYIDEVEDDYRRLVSNDSTCTFSDTSTGQITITRTLDERKTSNFFSDVVIKQTQYRTSEPGTLFNDFGSQEIRRGTSTKAKLAVIIVVVSVIVMGVLIIASRFYETDDSAVTSSDNIPTSVQYNTTNTVHLDLNRIFENTTTILT